MIQAQDAWGLAGCLRAARGRKRASLRRFAQIKQDQADESGVWKIAFAARSCCGVRFWNMGNSGKTAAVCRSMMHISGAVLSESAAILPISKRLSAESYVRSDSTSLA